MHHSMTHEREWRCSYTFLDLSTSWRWVVSFTPLPLYPWRKAPNTHSIGDLKKRGNCSHRWKGKVGPELIYASRHEDLYRSRYIFPHILNLYIKWGLVLSLKSRLIFPGGKCSQYPLNRGTDGPETPSWRSSENKIYFEEINFDCLSLPHIVEKITSFSKRWDQLPGSVWIVSSWSSR
jgi:hypothetical protein